MPNPNGRLNLINAVRKVLSIAVGFTVMLCGVDASRADTLCDFVFDNTIGGSNSATNCIKGKYSPSISSEDRVQFDARFNYACVSYDSQVHTDSMRFLENCRVISYSCMLEYYVEVENMAGCTLCPDGSAASQTDGHTNTTCEYCTTGFYYNGTACVACPSGGHTTVGWAKYHRPIEECCWTDATGSDETGVFEYLGGQNDCCYVQ